MEDPRSTSERESSESAEATLLVRPAMEKKRSAGEGRGGQGRPHLAPGSPAPGPAAPTTARSGPTPTSTVRVGKRVAEGFWAEGLGHSPCLQLLVQVLLYQPQVSGT